MNASKCANPIYLPDQGIEVACGHCPACLKSRASEWTTRLLCESVTNRNSFGLTLTYDNDHLPPDASLVKRDYQLFLMRFRKRFSAYKIKYLLVGEYGDKSLRPHFHLVVFGIPLTTLNGNFSISFSPLHLSSVPGSNRLYQVC